MSLNRVLTLFQELEKLTEKFIEKCSTRWRRRAHPGPAEDAGLHPVGAASNWRRPADIEHGLLLVFFYFLSCSNLQPGDSVLLSLRFVRSHLYICIEFCVGSEIIKMQRFPHVESQMNRSAHHQLHGQRGGGVVIFFLFGTHICETHAGRSKMRLWYNSRDALCMCVSHNPK